MTEKQKLILVREMDAYCDRDSYISDLCLSDIWGDADVEEVPAERIAEIGDLWDRCHATFKEIAAAHGMSCRRLAEHFCIPYRTAEKWATGERTPPVYTLLMMQELLG